MLSYRLAGLGSRISAHFIDLLVFASVYMALSAGITMGLARTGLGALMPLAQVPFMIGLSLGPFVYFIVFEWLWNGQTPGKRYSKIRVRMTDGTPVTFVAALTRNLLRPADMLPGTYLVGFLAIILNAKSQRIGDFAASTVVTYETRPEKLTVTAPHRVGFHQYEDQIGNLPGMTREEYEALRQFCDRIHQLSPDSQKRLYHELWNPIAQRRFIPVLPGVDPLLLAEATVMKYGRQHGLL